MNVGSYFVDFETVCGLPTVFLTLKCVLALITCDHQFGFRNKNKVCLLRKVSCLRK